MSFTRRQESSLQIIIIATGFIGVLGKNSIYFERNLLEANYEGKELTVTGPADRKIWDEVYGYIYYIINSDD